MVDKLNLEKYQPSCFLAHELVNKLAVIVGHCDLLEGYVPEDAQECKNRIQAITELAKGMAEELSRHQCSIDAATKAAAKKSSAVRA